MVSKVEALMMTSDMLKNLAFTCRWVAILQGMMVLSGS